MWLSITLWSAAALVAHGQVGDLVRGDYKYCLKHHDLVGLDFRRCEPDDWTFDDTPDGWQFDGARLFYTLGDSSYSCCMRCLVAVSDEGNIVPGVAPEEHCADAWASWRLENGLFRHESTGLCLTVGVDFGGHSAWAEPLMTTCSDGALNQSFKFEDLWHTVPTHEYPAADQCRRKAFGFEELRYEDLCPCAEQMPVTPTEFTMPEEYMDRLFRDKCLQYKGVSAGQFSLSEVKLYRAPLFGACWEYLDGAGNLEQWPVDANVDMCAYCSAEAPVQIYGCPQNSTAARLGEEIIESLESLQESLGDALTWCLIVLFLLSMPVQILVSLVLNWGYFVRSPLVYAHYELVLTKRTLLYQWLTCCCRNSEWVREPSVQDLENRIKKATNEDDRLYYFRLLDILVTRKRPLGVVRDRCLAGEDESWNPFMLQFMKLPLVIFHLVGTLHDVMDNAVILGMPVFVSFLRFDVQGEGTRGLDPAHYESMRSVLFLVTVICILPAMISAHRTRVAYFRTGQQKRALAEWEADGKPQIQRLKNYAEMISFPHSYCTSSDSKLIKFVPTSFSAPLFPLLAFFKLLRSMLLGSDEQEARRTLRGQAVECVEVTVSCLKFALQMYVLYALYAKLDADLVEMRDSQQALWEHVGGWQFAWPPANQE